MYKELTSSQQLGVADVWFVMRSHDGSSDGTLCRPLYPRNKTQEYESQMRCLTFEKEPAMLRERCARVRLQSQHLSWIPWAKKETSQWF